MAHLLLNPQLLACLVALPLASPIQDVSGELVDEVPTVSVLIPPKPAYRDLAETSELFSEWARAWPASAEYVDLGKSRGDLALFALRVGAPGGMPLMDRRTLLCIGGLDGISLAGSEAVLAIAADLLREPTLLPRDVSVLCIPWANPDGLAAQLAFTRGERPCTRGRNALEVDDDLDDLFDEDGADDIDGDGLVTSMLVEDLDGIWQRAADDRFLVKAGLGEGPRFSLYREGRDDDGDGEFNEDGPGGVRLDRNFPSEWCGPRSSLSPGSLPLSEPSSLAIAKLLEAPGVFAALYFEGSTGSVQGASEFAQVGADAKNRRVEGSSLLVDLVHELFTKVIGPDGAAESRLPISDPGSPATWAWRQLGVPSMRVSAWGPELGTERGTASQTAMFSIRDEGQVVRVMPAEHGEEYGQLACPDGSLIMPWQIWLDERRGGIEFVDWHPVALEGVGNVLVGGWEALSVQNPPEDQLSDGVAGSVSLVRGVLEALPAISLEITTASRDGELCTLKAVVQSTGVLPGDFFDRGGKQIRLSLPGGARLIAGAEETLWIPSEENSMLTIEWLVFAPVDALLKVQLVSAADEEIESEKEVRP